MKKFQIFQGLLLTISIVFNFAKQDFDKVHNTNNTNHNAVTHNSQRPPSNQIIHNKNNDLNNIIKSKISQKNKEDQINHKTTKVLIDAGDSVNKLSYNFDITYERYNESGSKIQSVMHASGNTQNDYILGNNLSNYKNDLSEKYVVSSDFFESLKIHMPYNNQGNNALQFSNDTVKQYAKILYAEDKINYFRIKATGILTCPTIELYANVDGKDLKLGDYGQYNFYKSDSSWTISLLDIGITWASIGVLMIGAGAVYAASKIYSRIYNGIRVSEIVSEGANIISDNQNIVNNVSHAEGENLDSEDKNPSPQQNHIEDEQGQLPPSVKNNDKPISSQHTVITNHEEIETLTSNTDSQVPNLKTTIDNDSIVIDELSVDIDTNYDDKIIVAEPNKETSYEERKNDKGTLTSTLTETPTIDVPVIIENHDFTNIEETLTQDATKVLLEINENTINANDIDSSEVVVEENKIDPEEQVLQDTTNAAHFTPSGEYWREYSQSSGLKWKSYGEKGVDDILMLEDDLPKPIITETNDTRIPTYKQNLNNLEDVIVVEDYDDTLKLGKWKNSGSLSSRLDNPVNVEESLTTKSIEIDFLDKKIAEWKRIHDELEYLYNNSQVQLATNKEINAKFIQQMNISLGINDKLELNNAYLIALKMDDIPEFNQMISDYFIGDKNIKIIEAAHTRIDTNIKYTSSFIKDMEERNIVFKQKFKEYLSYKDEQGDALIMSEQFEGECRKIDEMALRLSSDLKNINRHLNDARIKNKWFNTIKLENERQQFWFMERIDRSEALNKLEIVCDDADNISRAKWLKIISDYKAQILDNKYNTDYIQSWHKFMLKIDDNLHDIFIESNAFRTEVGQFEHDERLRAKLIEYQTRMQSNLHNINSKFKLNFKKTYNNFVSNQYNDVFWPLSGKIENISFVNDFGLEESDKILVNQLLEYKMQMSAVIVEMDKLNDELYKSFIIYEENIKAIKNIIKDCKSFLLSFNIKID